MRLAIEDGGDPRGVDRDPLALAPPPVARRRSCIFRTEADVDDGLDEGRRPSVYLFQHPLPDDGSGEYKCGSQLHIQRVSVLDDGEPRLILEHRDGARSRGNLADRQLWSRLSARSCPLTQQLLKDQHRSVDGGIAVEATCVVGDTDVDTAVLIFEQLLG